MSTVNLQYATDATLAVARRFVQSSLGYSFSELEQALIDCFFSNRDRRVTFIKKLPQSVSASLTSMFSRMGNPRGIRGIFVDSFIPSVLASGLSEVQRNLEWSANPNKFLKEKRIKNLNAFINYSLEAAALVKEFLKAYEVPEKYWILLTSSEKARMFIETWLDKYGHNSIGRMASVTFCIEGCSLLTAKSLEWNRPGSGFVELSTRYVNLAKAELFPIWEELDALGHAPAEARTYVEEYLFSLYREMQGDNQDGYFPTWLKEKYASLFPEGTDDPALKQGVFGECCDVGGNFLPLCTLTSVGITVSGEAFPALLKHLLLDATSENIAFAEMIAEEAKSVGADQFLRHFIPTEDECCDWRYLQTGAFYPGSQYTTWLHKPRHISIEDVILQAFSLSGVGGGFEEVCAHLYGDTPRSSTSFQKLPAVFENVTVAFMGTLPMRDWRDLQRMGMSTHNRTLVTPRLGFYSYDKPHPKKLQESFTKAAKEGERIYAKLMEYGCSRNLLQYILPMGSRVGFTYACNLRQFEFANWQRSKPDVNHSVRECFLGMELLVRQLLPWWKDFSRCNTVPGYVFARGESAIPLG